MKKTESPIELLIAISEMGKGKEVRKILEEHKEKFSLDFLGKGTVESGIADLFGFGVLERDIILSIIKSKSSSKLLKIISQKLKFDEREHEGLVMTIPINSIEKQFLNFLKSL